ncbi:GNAT family N-acetyltransferase [Nocardiopsis coralliicola]
MINLSALRDTPALDGDRVRLEPLGPEHADDVYAAGHDTEIRRLTGTHRVRGYDEVCAWCAERPDAADRIDMAILARPEGRFVGELALTDIDPDNESASYRIALSALQFTGRGIGKEATRLVLRYAFTAIGLHRVRLEVFTFNMRAIAVYRSCGFTVEGRLRNALLWDGRRHDALIMGVLAPDFRPGGGPPSAP